MPYIGRTPSAVPVTADDIPANSIDASKIIDGSIELAEISDNSITDAKLNSSKLDGIEAGATADQTKADIEGLGIAASSITGALPAIDGSALTSLTSSQMPAGSVLQVVSSIFTSSFSHSNTASTDVGHSVSITPKSATSTLYLEWVGNISTNAIQGMVVAIREGNTSIGGGSQSGGGVFNYNADYTGNTHDNQSMITLTPSTGLAARTFKISTNISHGSGTNGAKYEGGWGPCMLKITEIA